MKSRLLVPLVAAALLSAPGLAFGQVEAILGIFSIASEARQVADPVKVDSSYVTMKLGAPAIADQFLEDARAVTEGLGYQVQKTTDSGMLVLKQSQSIGDALAGKDWNVQVAINLKDDRTITVQTRTQGNGGTAESGSAKKIALEIGTRLAEKFAATK